MLILRFYTDYDNSKDFSLRYQNSNTALSEFEESAVFAVIWNDTMKNIGLCITKKAAKVRTLELIAIVNYPVIKSMVDDEDVEDVSIILALFNLILLTLIIYTRSLQPRDGSP
jgi:hypothetical protein